MKRKVRNICEPGEEVYAEKVVLTLFSSAACQAAVAQGRTVQPCVPAQEAHSRWGQQTYLLGSRADEAQRALGLELVQRNALEGRGRCGTEEEGGCFEHVL